MTTLNVVWHLCRWANRRAARKVRGMNGPHASRNSGWVCAGAPEAARVPLHTGDCQHNALARAKGLLSAWGTRSGFMADMF